MKTKDKIIKRILMSIIGVMLCGICVGFFKKAALGVDPFTSSVCGIDAIVSINYGTIYVIYNVVLLLFSLIFDRHYIGLATFINLFFLGYVTQYTQALLDSIIPNASIAVRIIIMIFAIVMLCFSAALYFTADLGVSTYDAVALVMSEKWKLLPFKYCRIIADVVCIIVGVILYIVAGNSVKSVFSIVNFGTIITAFFMGPLIDFFKVKVTIPMLNR